MSATVLVLGAGFGGLELTTILSETLGDDVDVTLIDWSDHFVFGYSKLDVMFGRKPADAVRVEYRHIAKPGVTFRQESITSIDPDNRRVTALDAKRRVGILHNQDELPYDLFLGVPKHRVPDVVEASGMTEDGWIPASRENLKTRFAGVYAIGDVNSVGTPKAGVFAEGAARIAAESIIAELKGTEAPTRYKGDRACYVEFGADRVGRVDVDFFSGPSPSGSFLDPSPEVAAEKEEFGASRRRRWFGV